MWEDIHRHFLSFYGSQPLWKAYGDCGTLPRAKCTDKGSLLFQEGDRSPELLCGFEAKAPDAVLSHQWEQDAQHTDGEKNAPCTLFQPLNLRGSNCAPGPVPGIVVSLASDVKSYTFFPSTTDSFYVTQQKFQKL